MKYWYTYTTLRTLWPHDILVQLYSVYYIMAPYYIDNLYSAYYIVQYDPIIYSYTYAALTTLWPQ